MCEIKIEKGIPFIDMRYSTESENEREILLPRNLMITCTGGYVSSNPEMYITTLVRKKTTKKLSNNPVILKTKVMLPENKSFWSDRD